jgi:preprotein translocase subunit SecA
VLVDEALVPLVLAGSVSGDVSTSTVMDAVRLLDKGIDFDTDAEGRNVFLTDEGALRLEKELGGIDLYSEQHVGSTLVAVNVALHAQVLVQRDVDYIVRDGRVQLINASRGRVADLQRWPDGLQAAVEIKEGLEPTETGEILDTITVQALINRYATVCGMTGTAMAAGEQLRTFYGLGVSVIEPNVPTVRVDEVDRVYDTVEHKNAAIAQQVKQIHETGQPILVGTHDVAESETLAAILAESGVDAVVLNAKNDAEEAAVIAAAGVHGHRLDADRRARNRHQARGTGGDRPRPHRRVGWAVRRRHRPPHHRAARQSIARTCGQAGRPGPFGVLRQLGGRRRQEQHR